MGTGTRASDAGGRLPAQNKGCSGDAQRGRGRASLDLRRERWGRGTQRSAPRQRSWGWALPATPSRCQKGLRGGHSTTRFCGTLSSVDVSLRYLGSLLKPDNCHDPVLV